MFVPRTASLHSMASVSTAKRIIIGYKKHHSGYRIENRKRLIVRVVICLPVILPENQVSEDRVIRF